MDWTRVEAIEIVKRGWIWDMLTAGSTGFADGLDVEYEKRGVIIDRP